MRLYPVILWAVGRRQGVLIPFNQHHTFIFLFFCGGWSYFAWLFLWEFVITALAAWAHISDMPDMLYFMKLYNMAFPFWVTHRIAGANETWIQHYHTHQLCGILETWRRCCSGIRKEPWFASSVTYTTSRWVSNMSMAFFWYIWSLERHVLKDKPLNVVLVLQIPRSLY